MMQRYASVCRVNCSYIKHHTYLLYSSTKHKVEPGWNKLDKIKIDEVDLTKLWGAVNNSLLQPVCFLFLFLFWFYFFIKLSDCLRSNLF